MSGSVRFCLNHPLISPMKMEHHGRRAQKLDLGSPWWPLGHYPSARARSWAFKHISTLGPDLPGCCVPAALSNPLAFVQLTCCHGSTFLAMVVPPPTPWLDLKVPPVS